MIRVKSVKMLEGFKVRLTFSDESEKTVDLAPYLRGPIFDPLREDPAKLREVRVDPELGTIVWPNGADICPDVLYHGRTPASQEMLLR
jgi:hypothetical protein